MKPQMGDDAIRLKLAKSIGLDEIPDLDDNAFKRLQGCLSNKLSNDFNAVKAVDEIRIYILE